MATLNEIERIVSEQLERDYKMYGCSYADLQEMIEDAICPPEMLAMGILSDAQEVMSVGDNETARQYINKAKWVMSQMMRGKIAR